MHPLTVHQSSIAASQEQIGKIEQIPGMTPPLALQLVRANAQSYQQMKELEVTCYEYGHSDMRGFRNPDNDTDPVYREYVNRHQRQYGKEKSGEILNTNLHNVSFYPNASVHPRFLQMRVIKPIAVDRTTIEISIFCWKGAPDEINRRNITYANTVHSPSSLIKPDDLEAYRRVQQGLRSSGREWISQHSLFDPASDDTTPQSALSEHYIRNQYRAWLAYMCGRIVIIFAGNKTRTSLRQMTWKRLNYCFTGKRNFLTRPIMRTGWHYSAMIAGTGSRQRKTRRTLSMIFPCFMKTAT